MFLNILVAVDGSPHADEALRQAIDLAEREHSRLTLISSTPQAPASTYLAIAAGAAAAVRLPDRAAAEAVLRRAVAMVPADVPVTTVVTDQPIRRAILCRVKSGCHDLVVMGSRGRGAVRAAAFGSVSHYVLNHSPVPVLIVHADGSSSLTAGTDGAPADGGAGSGPVPLDPPGRLGPAGASA